ARPHLHGHAESARGGAALAGQGRAGERPAEPQAMIPASDAPLKAWREAGGALLRLRLNRPKANLIDREMAAALDGALASHLADPQLRSVLIDAAGEHFSYGASIPEHLPDQVAPMLAGFHQLIRRMVASPATILTVVHGQCLGGG